MAFAKTSSFIDFDGTNDVMQVLEFEVVFSQQVHDSDTDLEEPWRAVQPHNWIWNADEGER